LIEKEKKMKRILILTIVLGLALSLTTPVLAATPQTTKGYGTFSLVGEIVGLDAMNQTVTVKVLQGNRWVKVHIGSELTIATTTSTRFLTNDGITTTPIMFSDLAVGNRISALGKLVDDVWTATRITVDLKVPCP
jgi:hypothetical protein